MIIIVDTVTRYRDEKEPDDVVRTKEAVNS